ncbi:MAG: hypothetical protein K1T65_04510 [Candidatus Aramenus sp.]|nr:hypothetical protein [Candidatus Aramenus sp.]
MDKYLLALLGEAGATGLAKAFYLRFKEERLRKAYLQEMSHWEFFRKYKRSPLEMPVYIALLAFGLVVSLFGMGVTRKVIRKVETGAIDFYVKNFPNDPKVKKILEEEREHMEI